jgi:hypothetical protein
MQSALTFRIGYYIPEQFTPRHLWFLSNLFVLFLVFAACWKVYEQTPSNKAVISAESQRKPFPPLGVLTIAAVLSGLAFFAASLIFTWGYRAITVLSLVYFEPSRVTFYIIYFIAGVFAASRNWFGGNARLGRPIVWGMASLVLIAVYSYIILFRPFDMPAGGKFLMSLLRSALCMSTFGALLTFGHAFWNKPNPVDGFFSRNSYTVYIIHYPINTALAAAMISCAIPVAVKAAALFAGTVAISYLASEYVVRRHVGISVAAAAAVNVILLAVL